MAKRKILESVYDCAMLVFERKREVFWAEQELRKAQGALEIAEMYFKKVCCEAEAEESPAVEHKK